jgi:hypothetical protein
MNTDEYGEVVNGVSTYKEIAHQLKHTGSAFIGWTDEEGSHLDIVFCLEPSIFGHVQGGLHLGRNLFVNIMRVGAFGFDIHHTDTSANYYAEKLHLEGSNVTTDKLGELINGVKVELIAKETIPQ